MKSSRVKVVALSLLMAVVIVAGWLIGIAPELSDAATANRNRAAVLSQNMASEVKLRKLKQDYVGIDEFRKQLSILKVSVPASGEISTFVTELNTLANRQKVTVRSITVNDAKPYTPVAAPAANTPGGSSNPPTTNPRITSSNFIVVPVQFSVTGDYSSVLEFVHEVQVGVRLFLISNLSSTGATDGKAVAINGKKSGPKVLQKVDAMVGGYIYVLLDRAK